MDLFSSSIQESANLLPYDGEVSYYKDAFNDELAKTYYDSLFNSISWESDIIHMLSFTCSASA